MKHDYEVELLFNDLKVEKEYKFHPTRRWRFDYAIPEFKIAIEIEGGVWISGRHNRASGFLKDMEKYNEANILGWHILRYTPNQVENIKSDVNSLLEIKRLEWL